eukprot:scaffold12.g8038.t1
MAAFPLCSAPCQRPAQPAPWRTSTGAWRRQRKEAILRRIRSGGGAAAEPAGATPPHARRPEASAAAAAAAAAEEEEEEGALFLQNGSGTAAACSGEAHPTLPADDSPGASADDGPGTPAEGDEDSVGEGAEEEESAEEESVDPLVKEQKAALRAALAGGGDEAALARVRALLAAHSDNPHYLVAAAKLAGKLGDDAVATQLFRDAVAKSTMPSLALQASRAAWGVYEAGRGRHDSARNLLRQAVERGSGAPAYNALGKLEERAGDLGAAAKLYRAAVAANPRHAAEINPRHAPVYAAWALMEWRRGRYAAAKALFTRGEEAAEPHAPLLAAHAKMEAQRRNLPRARRLYRRALEADPRHAQSYVGLGQLEARAGNVAAAAQWYQRGLALHPRSVHLLTSRAHLAAQGRDPGAAAAAWEAVLAVEPANGHACLALGELHEQEGRLQEAARLYKQGTGCRDDKSALLCHAALAELRSFFGDEGGARAAFRAGAAACRPNARYYRSWAALEKRAGQLQAAADLFRKAVMASPTDDRSWLQWGLLERRRGRPDAAARCFAEGVRVAPRNPYIWQVAAINHTPPMKLQLQVYGALLFRQGKPKEGRALFREGVRANPSSPQLLLEWALAEEAAGQAEAAAGIYEQARRPRGRRAGSTRQGVLGAALPEVHAPLLSAYLRLAESLGREELAARLRARLEQAGTKPAPAPAPAPGQAAAPEQ